MSYNSEYQEFRRWGDGTRQELIPNEGEGIEHAIKFMRIGLKKYGREDLTFSEDEIEQINGNYYITLRKKAKWRLLFLYLDNKLSQFMRYLSDY